MPSHARPKTGRVPRAVLRAGLVISAAGAAVAAGGAATAGAAPVPVRSTDTGATASALTGAVTNSAAGGVGPLKSIQLDPLANTSVDPLNNAVGTQIGDFKPLSTRALTGSISRGAGVRELPLVGTVSRVLPG